MIKIAIVVLKNMIQNYQNIIYKTKNHKNKVEFTCRIKTQNCNGHLIYLKKA